MKNQEMTLVASSDLGERLSRMFTHDLYKMLSGKLEGEVPEEAAPFIAREWHRRWGTSPGEIPEELRSPRWAIKGFRLADKILSQN